MVRCAMQTGMSAGIATLLDQCPVSPQRGTWDLGPLQLPSFVQRQNVRFES